MSTQAERQAVRQALTEGANVRGFSPELKAAYDEMTKPAPIPETPPLPPVPEPKIKPEVKKRRLTRKKK